MHRSSVLVDVTNYAGWPFLFIYGFSMFIWPWFAGDWSWRHVQEVWDRWQTLNAGSLAFLASLIAFNIARFNEDRQREREFVAAKAFLPSTLSGLMEYCSQSASILCSLWEQPAGTGAAMEHPELPRDYREVFSNCIRHADPVVGSYLARILVLLQVHNARLRDAINDALAQNHSAVDRHTLIAYLLRLGELYARVGNLFSFARGEEDFQDRHLTWEDFRNAYSILDIEIDDFVIDHNMTLEAFTKRWIARQEKSAEEAKP